MLTLLASLVLSRPLVLAHFMPWFESKPVSGHWGWHWTMNHFDPDKRDSSGKQQLASRFRPIIGAYDSSDPDALECQTIQMKTAGIDGVFIDWYGTKDLYDYTLLNRNTQRMIDACSKVGLKFSIVLEDQVVPQLVKSGKSTAEGYATSALDWLETKWFKLPGYLKWNNQPVLLIFGPQYYKDSDLNALFGHGHALFTELGKRGPAVGAFGWPEPQAGSQGSWNQLRSYYSRAKDWPVSIAGSYPRFADVYKEAGVGQGYGEIDDKSGATFRDSLDLAYRSTAPFIQVVTWNDWGEGTQIEPSSEFGYRDLEVLQRSRRLVDSGFSYQASDLRVPAEIYTLRKKGASSKKLDLATRFLLGGEGSKAAKIIASLAPGH